MRTWKGKDLGSELPPHQQILQPFQVWYVSLSRGQKWWLPLSPAQLHRLRIHTSPLPGMPFPAVWLAVVWVLGSLLSCSSQL